MAGIVAAPRLPAAAGAKRRWSDLTDGERRFVVIGTVVDTALKIAMLVDVRHRDAAQVRGPKWVWASAAVINSAGVLPAVYFAVGVKHH